MRCGAALGLPLVSTLPWPGLAFRNITPATEAPGARLDREFFVEAGLLGGDARITVHRDSQSPRPGREAANALRSTIFKTHPYNAAYGDGLFPPDEC